MPSEPQSPEAKLMALEFGLTVRRLREQLGVSQEKFAEMTGHHRTYIGFLERGERTPNIFTASRVAKALNLSLAELAEEAGI